MLLVIAVGALVYTNSRGTERVVNDAGALQAAEAAIGAGDVHLQTLNHVALLATDASLGLAEPDIVADAMTSAAAASDRLLAATTRLEDSVGPVVALDAVVATADRLIEAAADDAPAEASRVLAEEAGPAHDQYRTEVVAHRDALMEAVQSAGTSSGRWSRVAGFLTAFLVPVIAMAAYRQVVQRQLRLATVQLESQLEAEHEIAEAKDQFIADISHELRTPLTSIYGFSEVLLDDDLDEESQRDLLTLINNESAELARMVEDLLVAARDPASDIALEASDTPIELALEGTTKVFERAGFAVEVRCEPAVIRCDLFRFGQIMRNLLSNTHRHGGEVVQVHGHREADRYVIAVRDNGPGVDTTIVPRLFTRFVHGEGQALTSGSVGLGLAVAARLAESMGGSLEYERKGRWTVFNLSVPLAATDMAPMGWPGGARATA